MPIEFTGLWSTIDHDLIAILADAAQAFTFSATDYPCVITRPARSGDPMEGGEWPEYSGRLTTRRALFESASDIPAQGDSITISGVVYVVNSSTWDDQSPAVEISFHNTQAPR